MALAIGVDLGGTNARAAVVDADTGEIVAAHKEPLHDRAPTRVVGVVVHAVREATQAAGLDPGARGVVGVGVAGQCLGRSGVVLNAPNLGWRDVPFGELLRPALGLEVRVANDLTVAAWGEKRFGAAKGIEDVVLVFVGTGVGSGLILGGKPYDGAKGLAGEFGHVKVRPPRRETKVRRCGCGQDGCLEAYTSGVNVAARVREEIAAGAATGVLDLVDGDLTRVSSTPMRSRSGRRSASCSARRWRTSSRSSTRSASSWAAESSSGAPSSRASRAAGSIGPCRARPRTGSRSSTRGWGTTRA